MFIGLIDYSKEDYNNLWKDAIFVIDTNILTNFYKFTSKESTKTLFKLLMKFKEEDRLWIPHQVALEYLYNYENNINKPLEGYKELEKEINTIKGDFTKMFSNINKKHPYIEIDDFREISKQFEDIVSKIAEKKEEKIEALPDKNQIKNNIFDLLEGIVGNSYKQEIIEDIQKEGKQRFANKIPPGFEDDKESNKQLYRTYGDLTYQLKFGDLILWRQIIDYSRNIKKPIIFVTEDKKEDWWEKDKRNNLKRPHPHLLQEFFNKTEQRFYMYRTDNFVRYAQEYNNELSLEEVHQFTEQVENIRKFEGFNALSDSNRSRVVIDTKLKDLSLIDIKRYLDDDTIMLLNEEFNSVFDMKDFDEDFSNQLYIETIKKALLLASPIMESRFEELLVDIRDHDPEYYLNMVVKNYKYPKDSIHRAIFLKDAILDLEASKMTVDLELNF
ncbi:PIN-like domain-containing protein [Terribacillus halophilus]|uniref:PIN-like domain-containing protein n=1 Tax=Terribacillus halophilus TaxID=361279 RepID=UPI002117B9E4|nr:PIN domain-containing protein [Terribacillus halophilus]